MLHLRSGVILLAAAMLGACQTTTAVQQQTAALTLSTEDLAERQGQMRRFDTSDEASILSASAGVLQDLGFNIDESSAKAGLIVASKDRDAVEAGQVAGQVFMAVVISALGGRADPIWDRNQKIRISVITKPSTDTRGIVVRVTFQRVVWNTKNVVSRVETLSEPKLYQQFFDKLAQSVFLDAHQI